MANQAGYFNIQEFTVDGDFLVGGRVYTYIYGTTTHKIAYTDADGLISQTYTSDGAGGSYIALDARGELPAPLYLATGAYDICLKTAAGATIWTRRADPAGSSSFSVPVTFTSTVTFEDNVTFEENVTIGGTLSVTGDSTFQDVLIEGDLTFGSTGDIDLPDGSVDISDLSEEVINLILSSGSGGGGNAITSGDGRLSLATGVKVMVTDYTAVTTVYYVGGTVLSFNDGTDTFQPFTIGELSQTLASSTYSPAASAASKAYDMFAWKRTIAISGITRASTTATVTTSAAHNITTGAVVYITGADQAAYNGYKTLTGGSGSTFTFEVAGSPTTPATGTISSTTATLSRGPAWRNAGQVITGATNATPIVITSNTHGLLDGDSVTIAGVQGNNAANGTFVVASSAANTFALTGSVGTGAYIAGTGSLASRGAGASTTAITLTGSTYTNTVTITNGPTAGLGTYLGSIYTNASNQLDWKLGTSAAGGGEAWLAVWNVSNQTLVRPSARDNTNEWSYTTATARRLNNSATNRITIFRGLNINSDSVTLACGVSAYKGGADVAIAVNSTTVQGPNATWGGISSAGTGVGDETGGGAISIYGGYTGLGMSYFQGLELGAGTPTVGRFFGLTTGYTAAPAQVENLFGEFLM